MTAHRMYLLACDFPGCSNHTRSVAGITAAEVRGIFTGWHTGVPGMGRGHSHHGRPPGDFCPYHVGRAPSDWLTYVREALADVYQPPGVDTWLRSRNSSLGGAVPQDMIAAGDGQAVFDVAYSLGEMIAT